MSDLQESEAADITPSEVIEKLKSGEYVQYDAQSKESNKQSGVWKYFNKIKRADNGEKLPFVICNICEKVIRHKKQASTSNMRKHRCFMQSLEETSSTGKKLKISEDADIDSKNHNFNVNDALPWVMAVNNDLQEQRRIDLEKFVEEIRPIIEKGSSRGPAHLVKRKCKSEVIEEKMEKFDSLLSEVADGDVESKGELKGMIKDLIEKNLELEAVKGNENYKSTLDIITYCNFYRKQVERFESLFGKPESVTFLPTFEESIRMMIAIFVKERKLAGSKDIQLRKNDMGTIFRDQLTRIEKWRIILFWIFIDQIQVLPGVGNYDNFREEIEKIENWLDSKQSMYITDCETVQNSLLFKAIHTLSEHCLKTISMPFGKGVYIVIIYEIKGIATAVQDGFQRCSKEIERFENCATPEQYVFTGMDKSDDVEDDYIINLCLELIVKTGKELLT